MKSNYFILYFKILILSPIILLFFIFRIFFDIKIGKIQSSLFGHLLIPIELYLCEKNEKFNKNKYVIWFHEKEVVNKFILNKWKKKLIVFPRFILEPLYVFFQIINSRSNLIYSIIEKDSSGNDSVKPGRKLDIYGLLKKYPPFLKFTKKEEAQFFYKLNEIGVSKKSKIVCFHARSRFFRNENYEASRNSDVNKQLKGLKILADKGYKCLRLGKNEKIKLNFTNQNIIDYSFTNIRDDGLDFFIVSKCDFFISASSGIAEMATLMRKKKLLLDFIHFDDMRSYNLDTIPIILPKKILNRETSEFINYSNIFEIPWVEINNLNINKSEKYDLVDNSEDEITNSIINMYKYINNNLDLKKERNNQEKFWIRVNNRYRINSQNTIICPTFFDQNKKILID